MTLLSERATDVVVGLLTLAVGLAAIGYGGYLIYQTQTSNAELRNTAEPVDAVVISSQVVSIDRPGQLGSSYVPNVTYRYTYRGEEYVSRSVFPGEGQATREGRAHEIVESYPEDTRATAYVLPDDPARAYLLVPATPWWAYVLPVGGVLLAWIGGKSCLYGRPPNS